MIISKVEHALFSIVSIILMFVNLRSYNTLKKAIFIKKKMILNAIKI